MSECVPAWGSPSLLQANSLSEVIDRLNPRVWSVHFAPQCNFTKPTLETAEEWREILPYFGALFIFILICFITAKLCEPQSMTPPTFIRLHWLRVYSLSVFVVALPLMRIDPSTSLLVVCHVSFGLVLISTFMLFMSGIPAYVKRPFFPKFMNLVYYLSAVSIAHFWLAPRENMAGYLNSQENPLISAMLGEFLLGMASVIPPYLSIAIYFLMGAISVKRVVVRRNGKVVRMYVKENGEWIDKMESKKRIVEKAALRVTPINIDNIATMLTLHPALHSFHP